MTSRLLRVFLAIAVLGFAANGFAADVHDLVLPEVMRENNVDMWITVNREGYDDPLTEDFGKGYVGSYGYYIFTDRGDGRIERAVLGVGTALVTDNGAYDIFGSPDELKAFIEERDPQTIALNYARNIGAADGLSHTTYEKLSEDLGKRYSDRFVSAEKLASDFRSRRVATEIAAFARAGEFSRNIAERAFSNEVITPGVTTLEQVAWWMREQQFENNLGTSFGMPSVYITGPDGFVATSNDHVIQRGDFLAIDWGVGYLNFFTDVKRHAYVLKEGETHLPDSIQRAFDNGRKVRSIVKHGGRDLRSRQQRDQQAGLHDHGNLQPADRRPGYRRRHHRLPLGRQPGPRHRPLDRLVQPRTHDLRGQAVEHVLDRAVRLYRDPGMGRQETAHPNQGRCDRDPSRRRVALPRDAGSAADSLMS